MHHFVVPSLLDVNMSVLSNHITSCISWRNIIYSGVYLARLLSINLGVVWRAGVDLVAALVGHRGEVVPCPQDISLLD